MGGFGECVSDWARMGYWWLVGSWGFFLRSVVLGGGGGELGISLNLVSYQDA